MAEVSTPIEVNFVLGPETERRLMESIVTAFTRAFAAAGEVVDKKFAAFGEDLKVGFKTAEQAASKTANEMERMDSALMSLIHGITIEASGAIDAMKEIKFSAGETIAATNKASKLTGKVITQSTQTMTDAARLEVEQIRATSAAHSVDTQRRMVQEKQAAELIAQTQKETAKATLATHAAAAKRRMIITQEMFHTLTRLEKAFGATVAGIAKTMTSALSKAFSGLGSVVSSVMRRHNTTIESEMRRTASTVESGMRKTNAEFTDGLSPALSKREAMMRSSFADQEKIVKRSAVRQAAAIETLQKETRTGVVGAANRGLNIGAFLGGAAIFTAARSTFKVGSEFVRGLAVLQSQLDLTGEQMKTVRELSIQLGNDITLPGVSALDAAEAIQILTKQFGSLGPAAVDAAEAAAKGTLQLSRAAGVGAEDAAQVIGSAINVFKIGADQAVTVADTVAGALAKAAGVSFSDFKDSFVQGATVFEQFVGPVEAANDVLLDFNTTLAVLAKNGITGSNAGAGLKQFFLQATKSSPKAQKVSAELAAKIGESGNIFFTATGKARKYDDALRILRAGLKGLTDEQRNSTLATLFGSRSITIASALINTTQEDYDNLRKSIQKQGLAAKIAAAQNTGFAGALDALMSVVETAQILLFEELNPILGKVTLAFATFFTNILNGKGVWEIIRRGLLGVAAGLGAVLAVKGVIELFGLLETALTLVLTPMGTFLLAAAAIGAAISILDDQSALFRQALKEVEHRLGQLVKQGLKLAETGLANLGDIIARDVIPFVSHLAKVVGEGLVRAFEATSRFVTDKVIPAFARMWAFIRDKVVPIIERVGKVVGEGFVKAFHLAVQFIHNTLIPALGDLVDFLTGSVYPAIFGIGAAFGPTGLAIATVVNTIIFFWDTIKPILLPAIEGFKTLGDAIRTAFVTGNFADVGAGFAAAGTGIMAVLRRIGGMIVDVLEGAFHTVVATMKRVFSLPNLINAGKGFLDFVEFIGNTIGKIVTDPRFLGALAAIALALGAAAALIAFRFLEGFTKAFLHNLKPNLMLLATALIAGLMGMWKLVFSNPGMTALVISGLLAVFKARSLIRGMTAAGEESGRGFFTGFSGSPPLRSCCKAMSQRWVHHARSWCADING